jgi:predicted MPP superfamily phosphohydrolase
LILGSSVAVVLAYLLAGVALVGVVNLVWRAIARRTGRAPTDLGPAPVSRRLGVVRWLTVLAIVMALVTTGYGFVRAQRPQLSPVSLTFADLPSNFDGLTIALLADLHVGATTRDSFLPMLVNQVNAAHPDLVVIAGDLVDGSVADVSGRIEQLAGLSAPYGVVVTTGNHEFFSGAPAWIRFYDSIGLRVLGNSGVVLRRASQTITVLGIHDEAGTGRYAPDLRAALDQVGPDGQGFTILVAHQPRQVFDQDHLAGTADIDLQLSGHTHGGQFWPFGYAVRAGQPVLSGVRVLDSVTVLVTRGVGQWGPPVRVGADPEVVLITLHTG